MHATEGGGNATDDWPKGVLRHAFVRAGLIQSRSEIVGFGARQRGAPAISWWSRPASVAQTQAYSRSRTAIGGVPCQAWSRPSFLFTCSVYPFSAVLTSRTSYRELVLSLHPDAP